MNTHLLLILPIRALIRAFLCFAVTAAFAASANGQVYLSFSGGSGSPISMTLAAPIHYTINVAPETSAPLFLFQDVGSMFYWPGGGEVLLTGNLRYSVNGVGDYPMTNISSGVVGGAVGFLDAFLGGGPVEGTSVAPGDVITLSSGTITTNHSFAAAVPESRFYQTYLVDGFANRVSDYTIPEPSTYALFVGLTCISFAGLARRRRRNTSAP